MLTLTPKTSSNSFKILINFSFKAMTLIKNCAFSYVIKPLTLQRIGATYKYILTQNETLLYILL